ncbi:MAG: ABC transporter substrate-binding protein [Thermodesulfobacteriota bacterium]|nr:ABC transporter substrate-binding protein [Thermodesulfobacteriota bacterium]
MNRTLYTWIITSLVACAILFSYSVHADVRGVTDKTIKIGAMADITGPGADVYSGVVPGWRSYITHINDQGGIHGRKIKFQIEDDRFSIPLALSAFKKMVYRDKVFAFSWAASGAGHTHAIVPLIEKEKIPLIAGTNNSAYFVPPKRYVFTVLPFYEDQVKILFNYLAEDLKSTRPKITLLYMESASSRPVLHLVRKLAEKHNAPLTEIVIPIAGLDMTSQVLLLKRAKPDYAIIHGYIANTAAFLRDAKKFGFKGQIIAMQYGFVRKTIEIARSAAQGIWGINAFGSSTDDSPAMIQLRDVSKKYNPGLVYQDRNFIQGWLCSMILCEGLKNAGRNLNSETLVDGWEQIRNFDTQGICGIVNLGPDNHKTTESSRIYKVDVENLHFIPITDWRRAK